MKTNTSNPIRSIVKKLNPFIAATFVVALLAGCDNKGGASAEGPQPKKLRLAFIPNTANEYWSIVHVGCDFAAKNLGNVELEFRFPTRMTAEAQKEVISALLERGVDGIAISPIDADQQAEFLNTVASKTLLICADSDAENSKRVCYIGTDNVAAGKEAGELLKAALPQGGKVALFIGYPNAQNTKDRVQGIQSALAGSGVQIVETIADDHKSPEAQKNATDMLAKHGDLAGMIGIYSYHGPALVTAARSAGKAGKVKIVCFDNDNETLAGIVAGEIYGTVVQRPLSIGAHSIFRMGRYLRGETDQLTPEKIFIPLRTITTREEVEDFQMRQKGLLQPDEKF